MNHFTLLVAMKLQAAAAAAAVAPVVAAMAADPVAGPDSRSVLDSSPVAAEETIGCRKDGLLMRSTSVS